MIQLVDHHSHTEILLVGGFKPLQKYYIVRFSRCVQSSQVQGETNISETTTEPIIVFMGLMDVCGCCPHPDISRSSSPSLGRPRTV